MATQVHMDTNKRFAIENGLNSKMSFKAIANTIHMDCTTVSKEIKKHLVEQNISAPVISAEQSVTNSLKKYVKN